MSVLMNPVPQTAPENGWLRLAVHSLSVAVPTAIVVINPPVQMPIEGRINTARDTAPDIAATATTRISSPKDLRQVMFAPLPAANAEVTGKLDSALRAALHSSTKFIELL